MRDLSRLGEVNWVSLEQAYGSAADVPTLLRALLSTDGDARSRARETLAASLDHQGVQRFLSTWQAVPYLVGLVADAATPERAELVRLLAELAVGDTCWFLHDGFHPQKQRAPDQCARAQAMVTIGDGDGDVVARAFPDPGEGHDMTPGNGLHEIYRAVADELPVYLHALDGGDDALRAAVPFLVAFLTEGAAEAAPRLTQLLDDASPAVRASAQLGLSHVAKFDAEARARALSTLLARWPLALGDLERRTLALALVRFEQPADTAQARDHLCEQLRAGLPAVIPDRSFPWFRVDSPPFVFCTTFIGTSDEDRGKVSQAACAAMAHITDPNDAADLATWLLQVGVSIDASTELEQEVLRSLADCDAAWHYTDVRDKLEAMGLPAERDQLRASLA